MRRPPDLHSTSERPVRAPARAGRKPTSQPGTRPASERSATAIRCCDPPRGACMGAPRAAPWAAAWAALVLLSASGQTGAAGAEPADVQLGTALSLDTSHVPLDGEWVVVATTGEATWRPQGDARWQPIVVGGVLPAPSEIETGASGGITLVLGGDRLVVAPSSRLILIARHQGEDQRLRQERGRLRVDIEPRSGRNVEIRTPLLSLGIKGTSFEVAVDPWQSSILVLDGRVTVSTADGGPPVELGPQQGLSQPTDLSQRARRLEFPDLAPTFSRTGPVRWHLAAPGAPAESVLDQAAGPAGSAPEGGGAAPAGAGGCGPTRASGGPERARRLARRPAALIPLALVAAAGLLLLIVPGLVLGHNLRQQWLERPGGKGKRRRSLIRGW